MPDAPLTVFAAGLGLMLYSPGAVRALEEGRDYMPPDAELVEPLRSLVAAHRVVLLGTGSPELDYELHVHRTAPSPATRRRASARVAFGLRVDGGELCVRDGYDPMEWHRDGKGIARVALPDGYYRVTALWLRDDTRDPMVVHLHLTPSARRVPGDGWPYLGYRVN